MRNKHYPAPKIKGDRVKMIGQISTILNQMDAQALEQIGKILRHVQSEIHAEGAKRQDKINMQERVKAHSIAVNQDRKLIRHYIEAGQTLPDIVDLMQKQGRSGDFTRLIHAEEKPLFEEMIRQRRNMEIMRLAARGWTNKRIGSKVGLSGGQISRIVQDQLRATN